MLLTEKNHKCVYVCVFDVYGLMVLLLTRNDFMPEQHSFSLLRPNPNMRKNLKKLSKFPAADPGCLRIINGLNCSKGYGLQRNKEKIKLH